MRLSKTTPYFSKYYSFLSKNAPNSKGWEHFFDFIKKLLYNISIEMVKDSETS